MVDAVIARVIDDERGRIHAFQDMMREAAGVSADRLRPMLELDEALQMKIAPLRILEIVDRNARRFQHVDTGDSRGRIGRNKTPHGIRNRLGERRGVIGEIDGGQDDWRMPRPGVDLRLRGLQRFSPLRQLGVRDQHVGRAGLQVEPHAVAGAQQCKTTPGGGLG